MDRWRAVKGGFLRLAALLVISFGTVGSAAASDDIVFVIDTSRGMRAHDPEYRTPQAIIDLLYRMPRGTRVGIVLFAAEPTLAAPLTPISAATRPRLMAATDFVSYRGRRTNPAAAVERAIYHLRFDGRADARKWIVLVSDGTFDVGSTRRERDLQRWLEDDLTQSAVDGGIRIVGIGFTDGAQHRILSGVASRTGGEFLPVFSSNDLTRALEHVHELVVTASAEDGDKTASTTNAADVGAPEPVVEEEPKAAAASEQPRRPAAATSWMVWLGAGVAVAVLLCVVIALVVVRSRRDARTAKEPVRKALLIDQSGITGRQRYDLEGDPVVIGRHGSDQPSGYQSIVIDRKTVSRRHAVLLHRDFGWWIADQGTKNGTFVNGVRVVGQRRLEHGDRIEVEDFAFEFRIPDEDEADRTILRAEDVDGTIFRSDEVQIDPQGGVDETASGTGTSG